MPNKLVFEGLDALRAELRNLPAALTAEASDIIDNRGELAHAEIYQLYARVTGNLRAHLTRRTVSVGQFGAGIEVRSTAKHAWLYDNGSQARHWASGKSTGAMWGKTPPTHVFVKTMIKHRRKMYEQLKALLVRHGLTVSGEP